jgi:hypothetical protein
VELLFTFDSKAWGDEPLAPGEVVGFKQAVSRRCCPRILRLELGARGYFFISRVCADAHVPYNPRPLIAEVELTHNNPPVLEIGQRLQLDVTNRYHKPLHFRCEVWGHEGEVGAISSHSTSVDSAACLYPIGAEDELLLFASETGRTGAGLPQATKSRGRILRFKDAGGQASVNPITIAAYGDDKIDGHPTLVMNLNFAAVALRCNGKTWRTGDALFTDDLP